MKRITALFLAIILCLSFGVVSALADDELTPEKTAELQAKIEENRALPEHQEGYVEEGDGCYYVVSWCRNEEEDRNIYGEFCFPADFDPSQTYPVVIYSHQNMGSHKSFKKPGWLEYMAKNGGYVGYCFDFCGGTKAPNCLSDMDYEDSTDETQVSDLNAIIEFVKSQPFCDLEHIFLLGGSRGGRDTALCGAQHSDDIAGLIILYGAVMDEESLAKCAGYTGDVLLIHGLSDQSVPYDASVNMFFSIYSEANSQLLLLSGKKAVHSFDGTQPKLREVAESAVLAFLNSHTEG